MATFIINQDVTTDTPTVEVTIDPNNPLPPGRHRFRLIVVDDAGNTSAGDEVSVIIADIDAPTAVLNAPSIVGTGKSFNLDGSKSFDQGGGRVTKFVFTYLGPNLVVSPPIITRPQIVTDPVLTNLGTTRPPIGVTTPVLTPSTGPS
ncbi:MAG: hypothetical protein NTX45_13520 [Proteobacteria bacterium]|nr:hypothetical protein [Pseudomonadota bacterium]